MPRFRLTSPEFKLVESDVKKGCEDLLKYRGFYPLKVQSALVRTPDGKRWMRVGEVGFPDYVIPKFCMETKRPGGKLSDQQLMKIMELERSWGIPVAVVESVESLREWLDKHKDKF